MVTDLLRLVCQVIGIDTNTMSAHQAGTKRQKIPLGASRLQYFQRIDIQAVKYQCQFIDQGNIDVALGVFDDLGRFSDTNSAGLVRTGFDDLLIQRIDKISRFRR